MIGWIGVFAALAAEDALRELPDPKVRHREEPDYPDRAHPIPFDIRCLATIRIGTDGVPTGVEVDDLCPEPFAEATRQGAAEWRWKPYRVDGQRVKLQTVIAVIYRFSEATPLPGVPEGPGFDLPEYRRQGSAQKAVAAEWAPWPAMGPYEPVVYPGPLGEHHGLWTAGTAAPAPAVVWLGGRQGAAETNVAAPFHEAGIVTFVPGLRGTSGNPGSSECGLGEVDDVIAAAGWLAQQPGIDPGRIYLAGYDAGATLALLVAESTDVFRGIVAVGPEVEPSNEGCEVTRSESEWEWAVRTPLPWIHDVTSPTWIVAGGLERSRLVAAQLLMQRRSKAPVQWLFSRPAGHLTTLEPALRATVAGILADTGPEPSLTLTLAP